MKFKSYIEFINEAGVGGQLFVPGNKGAISTNTADQELGVKSPAETEDEEDDQDRFNPSIINKFAAKPAGPHTIHISKKVSEGGLGDNQVAGQPVFTQTVDKSKQGYQDSMFYDEPGKEHPKDCECPQCIEKS